LCRILRLYNHRVAGFAATAFSSSSTKMDGYCIFYNNYNNSTGAIEFCITNISGWTASQFILYEIKYR